MELNKIKILLQKYEEGMTSLEEEKYLREYFATGSSDPQFEDYKLLFNYTSKEMGVKYSNKAKPGLKYKAPLKRNVFALTGIAASIILAIGLFLTIDSNDADVHMQYLGTIEDPEEAYFKAKETLQMVSEALNTGTQELNYVSEFEKVKNQYLKE